MASGFGINGGRGRCYPFWQEVLKCWAGATDSEQCRLPFEDYRECLYHRKEIARLNLVAEEYKKRRESEGVRDGEPLLESTKGRSNGSS